MASKTTASVNLCLLEQVSNSRHRNRRRPTTKKPEKEGLGNPQLQQSVQPQAKLSIHPGPCSPSFAWKAQAHLCSGFRPESAPQVLLSPGEAGLVQPCGSAAPLSLLPAAIK